MNRRHTLLQNIERSARLIAEHETILGEGPEPEKRMRSERLIREHRESIRGFVSDYLKVYGGEPVPEKVREWQALLGVESPGSDPRPRVRQGEEKDTVKETSSGSPVKVRLFYSYAHEDEKLRDRLEEHLSGLRRSGCIESWHDRGIGAGREWAGQIDENLKKADIILLLVSPSFLASDYCWDVEMKHAMERHGARTALVIPVILRPVDWEGAPFARLQALPKDAKAVTRWQDPDEALLDVARGIRRAVQELQQRA